MNGQQSCSWCHTMNDLAEKYCRSCGHRADVARTSCDCGQCGRKADPRPLSRYRTGE